MSTTDRAASLSDQQIAFFNDQGYLLLPGALDPADFGPLRAVFEQAVDRQAGEWLAAGKITDTCAGLAFEKRYAALREQLPPTFSNSWRKAIVSRPVYDLWQHPVLQGIARSLLGDELYASGTWNGRPRAPRQSVQTIDWHQDAHYMRDYAEGEPYAISVWMPLVPVDETSGCLQVIPGSHKRGYRPMVTLERNGLRGLSDDDTAGREPFSAVMQPGDVLLFTELTHHRALDNNSDYVRWSIDIRFFNPHTSPKLYERDTAVRNVGYYCFSAADPSRVEPYEAWAAKYDWDGEF